MFARKPPPDSGAVTIEGEAVPYAVHRSARRRRTLALSFDARGGLVVAVPQRTSMAAIIRFVEQQAAWIARQRRDLPASFERRYAAGETFLYLGEALELSVTNDPHVPRGCRREGLALIVNLPAPLAPNEETRFELLRWYRRQARAELRQRLDFWAESLNLSYRRLLLTDPRCRWGSCDARDTIRLCWRIVMAPAEQVDYLVAHELCHVRHKDHSARFWALLASVMPDHAARRAALKAKSSHYFF